MQARNHATCPAAQILRTRPLYHPTASPEAGTERLPGMLHCCYTRVANGLRFVGCDLLQGRFQQGMPR